MATKANGTELTKIIKEFASELDLDMIGIAKADDSLFQEAPPEHQPMNILEGAKSVIITGKMTPRGTFKLNHHRDLIIHRVYHSLYKYLDICATRIADFLESHSYFAIPIPSYIPLSFRNLEPWGVLSLKHAAVAAGLGKIAPNGLFIHPKFGTLIRLSGVITTAPLTPDPRFEGEICKKCNLCIENCPAHAFDKTGKFQKLICLREVVKHGFNIFHPYDRTYVKHLKLLTNTMLLEYSIGCTKCLEVCPVNTALIQK
ncbi:MAG: 4Fe-4S double cluster binding domain-containing protein [Candidatus Helarchaeota archaeon]